MRPQVRLHFVDVLGPLLAPRLLARVGRAARPVQAELGRDGVVVRQDVRRPFDLQPAREMVKARAGGLREEVQALLGEAGFVAVVFLLGHGGFSEGDVLLQGVAVPGCDGAAAAAEGLKDIVAVSDGVVHRGHLIINVALALCRF